MLKLRILRILFATTLAFAMFMLPACSSADNASNDQAQTEESTEQNQGDMTVHVVIDTMAVDSAVMFDDDESLPADTNAYDALLATGLDVVSAESPYGGEYVTSIGGLSEKQYGDMSGWGYTVNGEYVATSASETILHDGDTLTWSYITG